MKKEVIGLATLYLGDCTQVLDLAADVLITDPPFGITDAAWDKSPPHADSWMATKGAVCFAAEPYATDLIKAAPLPFKYDLVWAKNCPTNTLNCHIRPSRSHERILVFGAPAYIAQRIKRTEKEMKRLNAEQRTYMQWKAPESVLYFDAINNRSAERTQHSAQKPVELMEYLVLTYSLPNEVVRDPFMGSGSTGVACVKAGRHFVGIEIDPEFFALACQRIEDAQRNPGLFEASGAEIGGRADG